MADYFRIGWNDASAAQVYAYSLPPGTAANSEIRATYRAGWISERARRGKENLPAMFAEFGGRPYWIVSVESYGRPVYNVTPEKNGAGYYDLRALMKLKGDHFAD